MHGRGEHNVQPRPDLEAYSPILCGSDSEDIVARFDRQFGEVWRQRSGSDSISVYRWPWREFMFVSKQVDVEVCRHNPQHFFRFSPPFRRVMTDENAAGRGWAQRIVMHLRGMDYHATAVAVFV